MESTFLGIAQLQYGKPCNPGMDFLVDEVACGVAHQQYRTIIF